MGTLASNGRETMFTSQFGPREAGGAGGPRPTPAAAARRHFYMTPIKLDENIKKKTKCDNWRLLRSGVAKVQVKTDLFRLVKD